MGLEIKSFNEIIKSNNELMKDTLKIIKGYKPYINRSFEIGYAILIHLEDWFQKNRLDTINPETLDNTTRHEIDKQLFVFRTVRSNLHNLFSAYQSFKISHVHSSGNLLRASLENLIHVQYIINSSDEVFDLFFRYVNTQNIFQDPNEEIMKHINIEPLTDEEDELVRKKYNKFQLWKLRKEVYPEEILPWIEKIYRRYSLSTHYPWFEFDALYIRKDAELVRHAKVCYQYC